MSKVSTPKLSQVVPADSSSQINQHILNTMRSRRHILRLLFFASCIWNLAAPFKAWALSQYGFLPMDNTFTLNLEWSTEINGRFLTELYNSAGIALTSPLSKTRYINVFLDFMISPRSKLTWVHSLNISEDVFQIDLDGNSMRSSLNGSLELSLFNRHVELYKDSGFNLWGAERIFNYVPPNSSNVSIAEVAEALLCLRNMPLEVYVNSQYPSPLDPYANADDEQAITAWRNILFPNLTQCLSRRAYLMATSPSVHVALSTLASELATAFNLNLYNIAGHGLLYMPHTFQDGFMDLTGQPSGSLTYGITGRDPSKITRAATSSLDTLVVAREAAWWCVIQYIDPLTNAKNTTKCFEQFAVVLPCFFLGKYLTTNAGNRYNDNYAFAHRQTLGNLTPYDFKPLKTARLDDIAYVQKGNLTMWNVLFKELIALIDGTPIVYTNALEELCLVGDGCFSSCMNESASGGSTITFKRGGTCLGTIDTVSHGLPDLYVDKKCFGLGEGSSHIQVTYLTMNGTRVKVVANNTAAPLSILACFVGGRAPQSEFPSNLMDMLVQGPQAALVITRNDGSEAIILNFIALVALVGYLYYFGRTIVYLYCTVHWLSARSKTEDLAQLTYSIVNCNISSVIWSHHRTSMQIVGFLSFIAWHLGAMQNQCSWNTDSLHDVSKDPSYTCDVKVFGHFSSFVEIARLFAYSWVFFALNFMEKMPGIATCLAGYMLATILLGLIPLSILAVFVALLCQCRLKIPWLIWVHNQLFLVVLWLAIFCVLQSRLVLPYVAFVERCLAWSGVQKQGIRRKSPFRALVGDYYWTEAPLLRKKDMMFIPLSVLMEIPTIKLENIVNHKYYTFGLPVEDDVDADADCRDDIIITSRLASDIPQWLECQVEYYVRVHES